MKKIAYIALSILTVLFIGCTDELNDTSITQNDAGNQSYFELSSKSNALGNEIESSIVTKSRSGEDVYPNYFGGLYIDNTGHLVVLAKGNMTDVKSSVYSVTNSDIIKFIPCEYSYQELLDVISMLDNALSGPSTTFTKNVVGYALMTEENRVRIILMDNSPTAILEFKQNICDSPCLTFSKGEPLENHSSLGPGSMSVIKSGSLFYSGSYSFRAKETTGNKRNGLVTSGHLASVGDLVYSGLTQAVQIGSCVKSQESGAVDASFVTISSSDYTLSNVIGSTGKTLSSSTLDPKVGFPVKLCAKSCLSGSAGTIKSTTARYTSSSGTILTNLSMASYTTINGDSGGLVYGEDSNSCKAVGVNIGSGKLEEGGITYGFYCKASQVLSSLGVVLY